MGVIKFKEGLPEKDITRALAEVAETIDSDRPIERVRELISEALSGPFDEARYLRALHGLSADASEEDLSAATGSFGSKMEELLRAKGVLE